MITRSQITDLQKAKFTEIQKFFPEMLTLVRALKTNKIGKHITWNDNLQLDIPGQYRMTGAPQGLAYNDSSVPLKHADAAMSTAKFTYNDAGLLNSMRYDKKIERLNDVQALKLINRTLTSQWDTFMHQANIAFHAGQNGQVCAQATNAAGGSVITIPAGVDGNQLYEGLAVEFYDSGQAGFNFTTGAFNGGYYGIITTIVENADGSLSCTCVQTDGTTAAAFTAAHALQPLYMVSCYGRLPQGFADFRTKDITMGGATRAGRHNPIVIDASQDALFQANPYRAIHEMRLRVNRKGAYKCDTVYTDSYTFSYLCDKLKDSIRRDNTKEMVGFSTNVQISKDLFMVEDPDAPLGNIDVFPSKNVWIAPLGSDEPEYVDQGEYHSQRVAGWMLNEVAIWWLLQMGLYDMGQWGNFKNVHKLFMSV